MKEKKCFKCGETKLINEFYKHAQMKDGYLNKCKECTKKDTNKLRNANIEKCRAYDRGRANLPHRVDARKAYTEKKKESGEFSREKKETNDRYRKKYPQKTRARRIFQYNMSKGNIKKMPCSVCGDLNSEAHHPDYDFPLSVVWLCSKHHKELHVKLGTFRKSEDK